MKCYNHECKKEATSSFSEQVLDVNSTTNKWISTEPAYKNITWYYCSECMEHVLKGLKGQV